MTAERGAAAGRGSERASAGSRRSARASDSGPFHITLESGRWTHLGWIVIGGALGGLLVWWLGALGKGVGVLLLAVAAWHLVPFIRTLVRGAGRVELRADEVVLPERPCSGTSHEVPYDRIRHAFFLRRAVPWTRTGPILVIETDDLVLSYPRDWFSSDSDQRRIALALNRRLGRA